MPVAQELIAEIAGRLLIAEAERAPLAPLSADYPGLDEADAYQIQARILAHKLRGGERLAGKKVGATSQAVQQALGLSGPVYGTLLASGQVASRGTIPLAQVIHPRVECEIAFLLGADLSGPGVTAEQVYAGPHSVLASLEINDPRTREWKVGPLEVIADSCLAARFVLGERRAPLTGLDLAQIGVTLKKNGQPVAAANGAAVLGDPARALAWLANKLAESGQSLKAGEIVLPGSLTPLFPAAAGDWFEAEFDLLGPVSVGFA
jgi:2-keto-4-pentenoate hydratase